MGEGFDGEEFRRKEHTYQDDLQILGRGSLFELLCTSRSTAGRERLAAYLLASTELGEMRARQEAVKELQPMMPLREQIAVLGRYEFQDCSPDAIRKWLRSPVLESSGAVRIGLLLSSVVFAAIAVAGFAGFIPFSQVILFLLPLAIFQMVCGAVLFRRVRPVLKQLRGLTSEFALLQQGLALLERQQFSSAKLQGIVSCIGSTKKASALVGGLQFLLQGLEQREKEYFYLPSLAMWVGTQLVLAVERWRLLYQRHLEGWLDAWAEFEALSCLAGYAYEHPNDVFPEFLEGAARVVATQLGNPLIREEVCVRNDLDLGADTRFYVISGSNMAGKSTFLRSVGIGAVMASCGAPMRAVSASISCLKVGASIAISDAPGAGKSKFLAEVERLRQTIDEAKRSKVLFLVDEIFSGTNSRDRRSAAEAVVRMLVSQGAIGVLSTHDLAITEIAELEEIGGCSVHMESKSEHDPLDFDYKLKPGVVTQSSALTIAKLAGVDL